MKHVSKLMAALLVAAALFTVQSCGQKDERITVMSYNIRNSRMEDGGNAWDIRKPATAAMLDKINPDIFGVQEAYPEQVEYIREACPRYTPFGVGRDDGVEEGEHMSIFYNGELLEMMDGGTYWLSETPDEPSYGWDAACRRTATWALFRVKASGSEFYYVNTHLDHVGAEARRNGLALIVDRIADMNKDGHPMVLTGDFNVFPDDTCLTDLNTKMLSARATADVTDDKISYNSFGLGGSGIIDYIYYSGFGGCESFRVIDETFLDIPYISDHYPVIATLKF